MGQHWPLVKANEVLFTMERSDLHGCVVASMRAGHHVAYGPAVRIAECGVVAVMPSSTGRVRTRQVRT